MKALCFSPASHVGPPCVQGLSTPGHTILHSTGSLISIAGSSFQAMITFWEPARKKTRIKITEIGLVTCNLKAGPRGGGQVHGPRDRRRLDMHRGADGVGEPAVLEQLHVL